MALHIFGRDSVSTTLASGRASAIAVPSPTLIGHHLRDGSGTAQAASHDAVIGGDALGIAATTLGQFTG